MMSRSSANKQKLQRQKVVILQNVLLNNTEQPERNKRKLCRLLADEELVSMNQDDDTVKKYLQKFKKSYNLSKTESGKSKCDVIQNIGSQSLHASESVHVGVQCEFMVKQKDAVIQCNTVKRKDAGVQNNFLMDKKDVHIQSCSLTEKKDAETQYECQPMEQGCTLLWLINQCVDYPIGKNKDLNQLIRLCKKLTKKPPAELTSKDAANCPLRMKKMDGIPNRSEAEPDFKTVKKQKTEDTFKKPAVPNKDAILSSRFSFLNSNRIMTRKSSTFQEFRSLTIGERKKRKLYSPTTWERSKRYTENFVKDPTQHKLFT